MRELFGTLADGRQSFLYTIRCGSMKAQIADLGATLVRLFVPDRDGNTADVVLGYDNANEYLDQGGYLGTVVGRNANRVNGSAFVLNGKTYTMTPNEGQNNLHSGPDGYERRIWDLVSWGESSVCFSLDSPDMDQGFPGNAEIRVTYTLQPGGVLAISYDAVSDKDTVFNLTNHSYFNLAGHQNTHLAMEQVLTIPGRTFTVADEKSIPTGQMRPVAGSPMDFREPKPIGRDIEADYDALHNQCGYDHNFEVYTVPAAILHDPFSGRTMAVETDCPGVQFYAGNFLNNQGKDGVYYTKRSGICLETQHYPDSVNNPQWKQPFCKAGQHYRSQTKYIFK